MTLLGDGARRGPRLRFVDAGPAILDVARAMTDGYTTGGGLGLGLSGARLLVRECALGTCPDRGHHRHHHRPGPRPARSPHRCVMNRVRDTPVEDRIRVPEVRVAVEGARSFPAPDAHAVAVAAPVATEPAPRLVEPASGDRIAVRATGPSGTRVESTPCARSASLAYGPGVRDAPAALRVPWEAGSAARPPRDDSSVAVLTPDPPDGRP